MKKVVAAIFKGIGGIAALVLLRASIFTSQGWLLTIASAVVVGISVLIIGKLDPDWLSRHDKLGKR